MDRVLRRLWPPCAPTSACIELALDPLDRPARARAFAGLVAMTVHRQYANGAGFFWVAPAALRHAAAVRCPANVHWPLPPHKG